MLSHHQIRIIYDEGIEAVAATFRQLYEMIETDDERVQKLIACATSTHLKKIEQLNLRINHLEEELSKRTRQLHQLNRTVKELTKQLREARRQTHLAREAHLATVMKNSQTSRDQLTLLVPDTKRGSAATENIGILAGYKGVCVHDGLTAYDHYQQCHHSLCNAHILRELNYVIETSKASWATEMKQLLLEIKAAVGVASEAGKKRLGLSQETEFLGRYEQIVSEAGKLYQPLQRKKRRATTRRKRESPIVAAARKLTHRLLTKRDQILLFMTDFRVPFDNNQAERDLRMLKVKQKISGCFRTDKGAEEFCRMRSYISTMKKQGRSVMETIRSVFAGKTMMPALRC